MITASHSPAHDNGCKISGRGAGALIYEGELSEIARRVAAGVAPRASPAIWSAASSSRPTSTGLLASPALRARCG